MHNNHAIDTAIIKENVRATGKQCLITGGSVFANVAGLLH